MDLDRLIEELQYLRESTGGDVGIFAAADAPYSRDVRYAQHHTMCLDPQHNRWVKCQVESCDREKREGILLL